MIEKELEDFEDFYKQRVNAQFYKIKKYSNKLINGVRDSLIEIKVSLDHFLESGKDKIDPKSQRSLNFFSDRIRKEVDEIKIPEEEINFDNVNDLINSIKKLFTSINEIARKSLPKFHKDVQSELKELNYITRRLQKKQVQLENFMRNKYTDVKNAEYLLKKLPKLFHLKENIEHSKADLDNFEKELEERNTKQKDLNSELIKIEKNDLFKELKAQKDKLFQLQLEINDNIGFKKALKKLKFELERESLHISNVDLNYMRDFIKNPIRMLANERRDLPKFTALMVQLRHVLEENKLNLKTETKEKTIEQINAIFDEKQLQASIEQYLEIKNKIKEIEKNIAEAGLAEKLEDVKSQITSNSIKLEHVETDFNRKNKDYTRYLAALKTEREDFQNAVEEILNENVKINITFSF
ncbi:MAG: hypothetical protein ACFFDF_21960 [Candidatus Odinarchaeota archaeon]